MLALDCDWRRFLISVHEQARQATTRRHIHRRDSSVWLPSVDCLVQLRSAFHWTHSNIFEDLASLTPPSSPSVVSFQRQPGLLDALKREDDRAEILVVELRLLFESKASQAEPLLISTAYPHFPRSRSKVRLASDDADALSDYHQRLRTSLRLGRPVVNQLRLARGNRSLTTRPKWSHTIQTIEKWQIRAFRMRRQLRVCHRLPTPPHFLRARLRQIMARRTLQ